MILEPFYPEELVEFPRELAEFLGGAAGRIPSGLRCCVVQTLILLINRQTFDDAVGDITVVAEQWPLVEFAVPYTESGLVMVVPVKYADAWIFFKPFSLGLWLATLGILVYKMFVFWFVEHRSNPDFDGSWHRQLGNTLWFTLTSLFSVQRKMASASRVVGDNFSWHLSCL